jgi:cytochrome c oxidase assembly protein subunit 15
MNSSFSVWPHRLAILTTCATFPLLFIGGLVTGKGAGLAVPDWPTTFGYNMFLYPWSQMVGPVFYEHSHRLVGSFVGLCTIFLALALWLKESRRWLRWLGLVALAMVIVQGVLGGLRVILIDHTLAIVHAALAQAFFAFTVCLTVVTSRSWHAHNHDLALADGGKLFRLSLITVVMIYAQIIFGAVLRHTGERLDLHLVFALLLAVHVVLLLRRISRTHADRSQMFRAAATLAALLALQLALGLGAYLAKFTTLLRLPTEATVYITTIHLIVGALMLAAGAVLALQIFRLSRAETAALQNGFLREQPSL